MRNTSGFPGPVENHTYLQDTSADDERVLADVRNASASSFCSVTNSYKRSYSSRQPRKPLGSRTEPPPRRRRSSANSFHHLTLEHRIEPFLKSVRPTLIFQAASRVRCAIPLHRPDMQRITNQIPSGSLDGRGANASGSQEAERQSRVSLNPASRNSAIVRSLSSNGAQ